MIVMDIDSQDTSQDRSQDSQEASQESKKVPLIVRGAMDDYMDDVAIEQFKADRVRFFNIRWILINIRCRPL